MSLAEWIFWIAVLFLLYTYPGYFLLLLLFSKKKKATPAGNHLTGISIIIPAYNEEEVIEEKIKNTFSLDYPAGQKKIIVITDGSTDNTDALVKKYEDRLTLIRHNSRLGKPAAINRAMELVDTELVLITDANTSVSENSLLHIAGHFHNKDTGGVCGEKKVKGIHQRTIAQIGESLYWRYESALKKKESDFYSAMGAAGELFAFRKDLFRPIPENIICDDLYLSANINLQGHSIVYEPNAVATELPSLSLRDEMKRKIRISAGNLQATFYLKKALNLFRNFRLAFLFFSHRIFRWYIAPACLVIAFVLNLVLIKEFSSIIYKGTLIIQAAFYLLAMAGFVLSLMKKTVTIFSIPFYFCFMNICLVLGYFQFLTGRQNVRWQKAKRKTA